MVADDGLLPTMSKVSVAVVQRLQPSIAMAPGLPNGLARTNLVTAPRCLIRAKHELQRPLAALHSPSVFSPESWRNCNFLSFQAVTFRGMYEKLCTQCFLSLQVASFQEVPAEFGRNSFVILQVAGVQEIPQMADSAPSLSKTVVVAGRDTQPTDPYRRGQIGIHLKINEV